MLVLCLAILFFNLCSLAKIVAKNIHVARQLIEGSDICSIFCPAAVGLYINPLQREVHLGNKGNKGSKLEEFWKLLETKRYGAL